MDRHSDLILDSKLNTRFESGLTVHTYRQVSTDSERRVVVQREEHWRQISRIGSGGYGSVWLENCVQGHQDVEVRAVKEVSTRPLRSGKQIDYNRELEAVAKFSHDKYAHCFVKSFGWYKGEETLFIAMEYLPHGDLEQYLFRTPPLLEEAAGDVIYQVLEGLSYMHENKFAHRDLKPGNILIKSCPPQQWWVKIADFGISKRLEDETAKSTLLKGTLGFIAPELHELVSVGTSFATDMWALGEIAFQLMTKQPVFKSFGLLARYATQNHQFPFETLLTYRVSIPGQNFTSSLMVATPGMRLTAGAALKHQWMARYLPLPVQPGPSSQMTSSGNHQPPHQHNLRPSALGDVRGQAIPMKKVTYYLGKLSGHTSSVTSVAFSPDGAAIASGSADKTVRIWNAGTGRRLRELSGHTDLIWSVAFSPDGAAIASGSADMTVRIWDAGTGRQLRKLSGHTIAVWSVAYSPDGAAIASGSADMTVRIWDAGTGRQLRELSGHTGWVTSVAFSPDGAAIASGSADSSARIWDAGTGRQLRELSGHTGAVWSVAFSPDGAAIASGSADKTVRIWDAGTGRQLRKLLDHTGAVWSVAFSPDGAAIASGSADKTVRIWDARTGSIWNASTGRQLRELSGHTDLVWSVAFSPDGAAITSSSVDGSVRIWEADTR